MCDNVCAICDEGGDLTCCDGKCFRSFHATVESAEAAGSKCTSLGLPAEIVKGSQPFVCLNCTHEQHQCFVCGELGSSNKSSGAEVFGCSFETCGRFYHPKCVAKLIQEESDTRTQLLEEKIADGESFICPVHKCHRCKQEENEKVKSLQFAICRRCPKSYHRKCLPRTIVFDGENDETVVARAWNNLLRKSRALIFCLKHEIDLELDTPVRNIKFPEIGHAKKKVSVNEHTSYLDHTSNEIRVEKMSSSARPSNEIRVEKASSSARPVDFSRKRFITLCAPGPIKKQRLTDTNEKSLKKFVPVRSSFDHSSTVMENWKNSNTAVAQQHGHISEVGALPVDNPEIISEKVTSQTTEKAENWKSSKHIGIAQQHGHISAVQGPPLSDEHVEAFDLPVQNREIHSEKDTSQTTEKVINCKRSKDIDVAQQQGPVSKVHEPLLSEIVEAFDLPVKNHEFLGEKDTSRKTEVEETEVEDRESSKHTAIAQQHGHISQVQGQPLSENVSALNLPVENRLSVNEKDTASQTTEEMETRVSKELSFVVRHVHLSDSPVENCKSNGEKHAGQTTKKRANRSSRKRTRSKAIDIAGETTKKRENRNSRKWRRRNKAIAIAQHCISNIQEPKIPGKSAYPFSSQVNNCDLNAEKNVSQTTTKATATCLIRSQKESTRCDNSSGEQPYNNSRRPADGVHFHGYERDNDYHDKRGYSREAYNGYRDKPYNPPTAQRYIPKLDEVNQNWNHNWMENRGMFYDHHLRGCDPHMHAYYGFAPGPLPYGPHHNSSWGRINERIYY